MPRYNDSIMYKLNVTFSFDQLIYFLTTRFKALDFDGGDRVFSCRHILRVSIFTERLF